MARYDAAGTGYNNPRSQWAQRRSDRRVVRRTRVERRLRDRSTRRRRRDGVRRQRRTDRTRRRHRRRSVLVRQLQRRVPLESRVRIHVDLSHEDAGDRLPGGIVGLNAGGGHALFGLRFGRRALVGAGRDTQLVVFGASEAPPPIALDDTVYAAVPGTGDIVALSRRTTAANGGENASSTKRRTALR